MSDNYWRMNTAHDVLLPCPVCGKNRDADAGHKVCRVCEGVAVDADDVQEVGESE